jgi:protein-tyrosine phosphatase
VPTKIYWIHRFANSSRIGIMARPRGNDWLEDEIINLKNCQVGVLVSLLERDEIYDLNLDLEKEHCFAQNIIYINFPISDRGIPKQNDNTDQLIGLLMKKINEGLSVVVHCRMGIGRSSIIAAAILLKYKFKANDIIENIIKIRGIKVPDTDDQLSWLKARERSS